MCGGPVGSFVVYMSAGATADALKSKIVDQETFWSCGVHATDPTASIDVKVVDLPGHDQFDLAFCSTACLRRFLSAIVDELELQRKED
jgi:hypothetical protein